MKVLKFGGMTLETTEKIKAAAQVVQNELSTEKNLIVVVSAMGKTTNELIALAKRVSDKPAKREMDMLLSVGERISMSLMSIALHDLGISSVSLTGSQAGILTTEEHEDAQILEVKPIRLQEELQKKQVIIVAGFQGVSAIKKEITTLGRGGSDITAAAFAAYFQCPCVILKEVPGVMSADPELVPDAFLIPQMDYASFIDITKHGAKVVNSRAAEFAAKSNVTVKVQKSCDSIDEHKLHLSTMISAAGSLRHSDFVISTFKGANEQTHVRITAHLSQDEKKQILQFDSSIAFDVLGASFTVGKQNEGQAQSLAKTVQKLHQLLMNVKK